MSWTAVTSDLKFNSGAFSSGFSKGFDSLYAGTVTFDVPDTTTDDIEETVTLADYFNSVIGG